MRKPEDSKSMPLFPQELYILQSSISNCFLLAIFAALYGDPEQLEQLKLRFIETEAGVTVKLCPLALRLDEHEKRNFSYHFDQATREHVFFFSNEQLAKIEKERMGVFTNSLALKLLEQLIPYFFSHSWEGNDPLNAYEKGGSVWMSQVLGCHVTELEDFDMLIKLKTMSKSEPICFIMPPRTPGALHHVYWIKAIVPDPRVPGRSLFILGNPYNDDAAEIFPLTQEEFAKYPCYSVKNSSKDFALKKIIANLPESYGKLVSRHPSLYADLLEAMESSDSKECLTPEYCQEFIRKQIANAKDFYLDFIQSFPITGFPPPPSDSAAINAHGEKLVSALMLKRDHENAGLLISAGELGVADINYLIVIHVLNKKIGEIREATKQACIPQDAKLLEEKKSTEPSKPPRELQDYLALVRQAPAYTRATRMSFDQAIGEISLLTQCIKELDRYIFTVDRFTFTAEDETERKQALFFLLRLDARLRIFKEVNHPLSTNKSFQQEIAQLQQLISKCNDMLKPSPSSKNHFSLFASRNCAPARSDSHLGVDNVSDNDSTSSLEL